MRLREIAFVGNGLPSGKTAWAGNLKLLESVELKGDIAGPNDISALGIVGDYLIIGSDETNRCQVLKPKDGGYVLMPQNDIVLNKDDQEIDIEGIACEGNQVYAIGSHSATRPRLKIEDSYQNNREQLEQIIPHPPRDVLARFTLNDDGKAEKIEETSLRSVVEGNAILGPFAGIPCKENGIDVEGIAAKKGRLYIGFRGPVLRGNYALIWTCDFDHVELGELLFVNLGGLGIRDMAAVNDGFMILAGPVGDGPGSFKLFSWNGHDCLPGKEGPEKAGKIEELCKIPVEEGAKAEGIVITKEKDSHFEFLITYDGLKNGGIQRFRLSKE